MEHLIRFFLIIKRKGVDWVNEKSYYINENAFKEEKAMESRLKLLREERNLSPSELARTVGISLLIYQRYEKDHTRMKTSDLYKLALFFDCSMDYLAYRTQKREVLR